MSKVSVTYNAPKGDDKVVTFHGVEFFAGQTQELDADEHPRLIEKAENNPCFKVEGGKKTEKAKAPEKVDLKAGMNEATSHDFEADRQKALTPKPRGRPPAHKPAQDDE